MQVVEGNVDALSALFDKYHVQLYNFYYRQNRDAFLSEDLVQNVFERILKYGKSYTEEFPFKAWIYRIARNVNTDYYRKKRVKIDDNVEASDVPVATTNVLETIEQREKNQKLELALNTLKDDEKQIIHMTRFEYMKYAEVAQIMNLTESAVKVKVHRAIKKLRIYYTNCHQV